MMRDDLTGDRGLVINVQRFTIHDGPGIRTEFFLKGCPLRCRWCSNPESYERYAQVGVYPNQCIGVSKCGLCLQSCPESGKGIFTVEDDRVVGIDRTLCSNCLKCQDACPSRALKLWGESMTVEQCMKIVRGDRKFYEKSGGGVTISGGEPLLQWEFCRELARACRSEGYHICIETALHIDPRVLDEIFPFVDMMITDLKHTDSSVHREQTGVRNEIILQNLKKLAASGVPYILRIPVIPGFNDSQEVIDSMGDFILEEMGNTPVQVQLLRFRHMGEEKRESLGLENLMEGVDPDRAEFEERIRGYVERLAARGIPAVAGSTKKLD